MAIHIRDPHADRLVRELARRRGVSLTQAIAQAVEAELTREPAKTSLGDKVRRLQAELVSRPRTGLKADKAFFDDLSGQGDD
jgi:antitoxin VapB